jgi:hypothetical protein
LHSRYGYRWTQAFAAEEGFVSGVRTADPEKLVGDGADDVYLKVYMKGPDCLVNEKRGVVIQED